MQDVDPNYADHDSLSCRRETIVEYRRSTVDMRQLANLIWPSWRSDIESSVRWLLKTRNRRKILNGLYNHCSHRQKSWLYAKFAKIFRAAEYFVQPGKWTVEFCGRDVSVPLRQDSMWLDWDCALSVLGHESTIKSTYQTLIRERGLPKCVFDVGANYGLHSLLYIVHGVDVVSFEPNPACQEYLKQLEALNQVHYSLEAVALGSGDFNADLWYPDSDTWLGSIEPRRVRELSAKHRLERVAVPCTTIDRFVSVSNRVPELIKLDTEGSELAILAGASRTLKTARPMVIFECWQNNSREALWRVLEDMGYAIATLPLRSLAGAMIIDPATFSQCSDSNFAALPRELLGNV